MKRSAAGLLLLAGLVTLPPSVACAERRGSPRFAVSTVAVGRQPNDVALADVDGDGNLDVVTANIGSRDVSVLRGNGKGGFAPAPGSPVPVGIEAHLVVASDFDRDGALDLAVTEHDSNDVLILRGNRKGSFAAGGSRVRAIEGIAPHNHGLVVADFDGDRNPDLATSNNNGNSVSVLLGDGRAGFRPGAGSPFPVGRAPYPLAVADWNGDGRTDVATPDVSSHTVTVLVGDGRGTLRPAPGSPHRVGDRPYFSTAGDVNGDGAPDLVVSHDDSHALSILVNDGSGRFGTPRRVEAGGRSWKVRVADFDGDGRNDLALGVHPSGVAVLLGDGRGGFAPLAGSPVRVGRGPWGIAVGDLNRDGKPDAVTANSDSNDVSVLLAR